MDENKLEKNLHEIKRLDELQDKTWAKAEHSADQGEHFKSTIEYMRALYAQNDMNKIYNEIIFEQNQEIIKYLEKNKK